jgi:hypothetical protein
MQVIKSLSWLKLQISNVSEIEMWDERMLALLSVQSDSVPLDMPDAYDMLMLVNSTCSSALALEKDHLNSKEV